MVVKNVDLPWYKNQKNNLNKPNYWLVHDGFLVMIYSCPQI